MAEVTHDLTGMPKEAAYKLLEEQLRAVLGGIDDRIAAMATMAALIHHGFGHLWTGFYQVAAPGQLLRVGPYQGTLGCLEIAFGKGVCGKAAAEASTVIVPDVDTFPGHILCDERSRSEIAVPVRTGSGELIAVLDVDSAEVARFDHQDAAGLERLVSIFSRRADTRDSAW